MTKKVLLGLAVFWIGLLMPSKSQAAVGEWTWMSGSNVAYQSSVYGIKGVPSATNVPGWRFSSIPWIGSDDTLWLFGGSGSKGALNDLWRYDPATDEWTWMSGSDLGNQAGNYGTKGVADAANMPGGRLYSLDYERS